MRYKSILSVTVLVVLMIFTGSFAALAANGTYSSVTGGLANEASGTESSVTGGQFNQAQSFWSTVSGGSNRTAAGNDDWVAGSLFEDN